MNGRVGVVTTRVSRSMAAYVKELGNEPEREKRTGGRRMPVSIE